MVKWEKKETEEELDLLADLVMRESKEETGSTDILEQMVSKEFQEEKEPMENVEHPGHREMTVYQEETHIDLVLADERETKVDEDPRGTLHLLVVENLVHLVTLVIADWMDFRVL